MNERHAKKNLKKEEKLRNSMLTKKVSEATKENIKKKEELLKIIKKNIINLEKLQKDYNDNLDKDLMPIDVDKFKIIAENIKKIDSQQRKLKKQVSELEKEISKTVIEINESEEPTDELPVKEIKEELNKENESKIKVELDFKNNLYRIYSPYSKSPIIHIVSKELLDPNSKEYREYANRLKQKYGENVNLADLDLNVAYAFEEFDKKYNTNTEEAYSNDTFKGKIVYDLRKFSRSNKNIIDNDFLNSKQKRKLKEIAKNYNKKHDNCDIVQFSNKKAAMLLGSALVMGAVATSIPSIKTIEEDNDSVVEYLDGMPIDADENDIIYYDKDGNEISEDNTSSSTTDVKTDDSVKEEQATTENIFDSSTEDEIVEENDHKDFRVGDIIKASELENVALYESSVSPEPVGNTENWFFGGYKVDAISITDGNTILEVARDNTLSIQDLVKKYEKEAIDLRVSFHVEGLDKNKNIINPSVGWIDYSDISMKEENVKTR